METISARRALACTTAIAATWLMLVLLVPADAGARSAHFTAAPNPSAVGVPVRFDATGSIGLTFQIGCPSGIDWYEWDFDGDGVVDDEGKVVSHVFTTAGTHDVTLTVGVWAQWCSTASTTKPQTIAGTPGNNGASVTRSTSLSGAEQSETSAGDPDGTGSATVTVYPATAVLCFRISLDYVAPTNAGHVHLGARGTNGPPVVNLYSSTGEDGRIADCVPADPVTIDGLIKKPRDYYVQLHNEGYPLGVVRGQLGD